MPETSRPLPRRPSPAGPLRSYLEILRAKGMEADEPATVKIATDTAKAVRRALSTEDGKILMELLIVATTEHGVNPEADPRALAALNAQSLIAHDLRRIVSDEHYLGNEASNAGGASGTGKRTGRR